MVPGRHAPGEVSQPQRVNPRDTRQCTQETRGRLRSRGPVHVAAGGGEDAGTGTPSSITKHHQHDKKASSSRPGEFKTGRRVRDREGNHRESITRGDDKRRRPRFTERGSERS